MNLKKFFSVCQGIASALALTAIVGFALVTLLGLETTDLHDQDIIEVGFRMDSLELQIHDMSIVQRCILWGVDPERCEAAGVKPY